MRSDTIFKLPNQMIKNMGRDQVVILDVRTCHEYSGGHIDGSFNIPYDQLDIFMEEVIAWNKPIIVVSAAGRRSHIAADFLNARGLEAIDGGDWEELNTNLER